MAPLIPPNQPIDPMRIPIRVCAALATVPAPPVTCYITRSSEMIKLKSLSLSEASANRRLLYNGERVRHDDTLETLGIEDDDIRGGVTFELMAEHSADEGVKRGSCPCIFSSDHPLCRLKVQRSGRHLIRTGPQLEIPLSLTISSFLIVAIHSNSILTLTMPLIPNDEEINPRRIPVLCKVDHGLPTTCYVSRSAKLIMLKVELAEKMNVDPHAIRFLIDGETLSRESSLASLGFSDQKIKTGITIEVLIEQAGG
ncbi:hypothetical protein A1Q2_07772 [Trichosporon asahii var. asahii CBS 8904]|uniref:Ubiquitin-like domain-containing protein n=1 Tax=Trichosporon asahii var. asahii (strain CBS 8904) TaxID=1220162 RepID=K1VAW1_TRIAC|nr:hypothetical protein A1Q2_07772 [Trichosporon asahii var. asahii CBS 8904]